uniref:Uncharacterized protein n=1 Tax=Glossina brevipalpis TaxID=37001 RepID=A0A1A9WFF0_9MUSC
MSVIHFGLGFGEVSTEAACLATMSKDKALDSFRICIAPSSSRISPSEDVSVFKIMFSASTKAALFLASSAVNDMLSAYSFSAAANFAFLGATTLATLSYKSIAIIHWHKPFAALEALATILGSKSLLAALAAIVSVLISIIILREFSAKANSFGCKAFNSFCIIAIAAAAEANVSKPPM